MLLYKIEEGSSLRSPTDEGKNSCFTVKVWETLLPSCCIGIVEESHAGKEVNVSGTQNEKVASCIVAGRDGLPIWGVGEDHTPTPDDSVCNGNSAEFMGTVDANNGGG